jgi:hypothetical protein
MKVMVTVYFCRMFKTTTVIKEVWSEGFGKMWNAVYNEFAETPSRWRCENLAVIYRWMFSKMMSNTFYTGSSKRNVQVLKSNILFNFTHTSGFCWDLLLTCIVYVPWQPSRRCVCIHHSVIVKLSA